MSSELILKNLGYSNLRILGSGSYGSVFGCTSASGAEVAVKISFGREADATEREAAVMALIPPHPNVLSAVDFQSEATHTVLAMPLATGGDTLKFMMERNCTPLAESEVRGLFSQLLDAVEHIHRNGIVHRDIKCENLLLTGARRRHLLLADFGFAAHFKPSQKLSESLGSLHYSAPEIVNQVAYDGTAVDVWSMGVVLFAWATGRLPFGGATEAETEARIRAGVFAVPHSLSPELAALIHGMLTVDPAKRLTVADIRNSPWMATEAPAQGHTRSNSEPSVLVAPAVATKKPLASSSADKAANKKPAHSLRAALRGLFKANK